MVIYTENQKFTQMWIYLTQFSIIGFLIFILAKQVSLEKSIEDNLIANITLIISLVLTIIVSILFYIIQLVTVIDEQGILIKFTPITIKKILWSDIINIEVIQYDFVGYGIRTNSKYNYIYNVKGNKGLLIDLKNGKKVLVGTQKEENLKSFVKNEYPKL